MKTEEQLLWERIKEGDVDALGRLYRIHVRQLFSYGIKNSNEKEYVMDCIHDLFIDLFKYRKKLSPEVAIEPYLFASLKRKLFSKNNQKNFFWEENKYNKTVLDATSSTLSTEDLLIRQENKAQREKIWQLTEQMLSKTQYKVLLLRFKDGMPHKEIAELMNITEDTSRKIIYRAVKVLRSKLVLPLLLGFFGLLSFFFTS